MSLSAMLSHGLRTRSDSTLIKQKPVRRVRPLSLPWHRGARRAAAGAKARAARTRARAPAKRRTTWRRSPGSIGCPSGLCAPTSINKAAHSWRAVKTRATFWACGSSAPCWTKGARNTARARAWHSPRARLTWKLASGRFCTTSAAKQARHRRHLQAVGDRDLGRREEVHGGPGVPQHGERDEARTESDGEGRQALPALLLHGAQGERKALQEAAAFRRPDLPHGLRGPGSIDGRPAPQRDGRRPADHRPADASTFRCQGLASGRRLGPSVLGKGRLRDFWDWELPGGTSSDTLW